MRLDEVLTRDRFIAWLRQHPAGTRFWRQDDQRCPLAFYLSAQGLNVVSVGPAKALWLSDHGEPGSVVLPPWAKEVVDLVDQEEGEITAGELLELLAGERSVR